jgi:hypothetical protein
MCKMKDERSLMTASCSADDTLRMSQKGDTNGEDRTSGIDRGGHDIGDVDAQAVWVSLSSNHRRRPKPWTMDKKWRLPRICT